MCDKTATTTTRNQYQLAALPLEDWTDAELAETITANKNAAETARSNMDAHALAWTHFNRVGECALATRHADMHERAMHLCGLLEAYLTKLEAEARSRNPFYGE